jgi:hypothetical protein
MHDVTAPLRRDEDKDTKAVISEAAADHGDLRHKQGYAVEMLMEESRLLQISIFTTLHKNVKWRGTQNVGPKELSRCAGQPPDSWKRGKVPTHQRLSKNPVAEGTLESVTHSAEPVRSAHRQFP